MPAEHCVITGCIAANLLERPTYKGKFQNDRQMYELTIPCAKIMATRLKGKPIIAEHDEGNGSIGEVLYSWVDGNKWYVQAEIDQSTRAGIDMVKAIVGGEGNPFPEQIGEFSLCTGIDKLTPYEVSWVVKGARKDCTIDNISLVDSNELETIKQQEYIHEDLLVPEHLSLDAPRISATFFGLNKMSNYTSIRQPAAPTKYESMMMDDVPETKSILQKIESKKQELAQLEKAASAATGAGGQATGLDEESRLEKRLAELRGAKGSKQQPPQGNQAANTQAYNQQQQVGQPTGDKQFDELIEGMHLGKEPTSGNHHTLYSDPRDAHFAELAGVFDSKGNVLTSQQKQESARKLFEIAQASKADREALAQTKRQVEMLTKANNEYQSSAAADKADKDKQRKQAATMIQRLLQKNTPTPTEAEKQEFDSGVADLSEGRTDDGFRKMMPQFIKASALMSMRDNMQNERSQQQEEEDETGSYRESMNKMLGISQQGLIQASAANRKRSRDVNYNSPAAAASAASNWKPMQSDLPVNIAQLLSSVDGNPEYDTDHYTVPGKPKSSRPR